jgi:hypothetical protein
MEFEKALKNEIARMRARLAELMAFDTEPKKRGPGRPKKGKGAAKTRTRRKSVSAARRKQMQQHGHYLAATRSLSATHKARVKKLRGSKGIPAAIREAKRLSRKPTPKRSPRVRKIAPQQRAVST